MLFLLDTRISDYHLLRLPAVPAQPAACDAAILPPLFRYKLTPIKRSDRRTDKRRNPLIGAVI